jgi:pimeloyl-ACP methyl ester carboxylesterase
MTDPSFLTLRGRRFAHLDSGGDGPAVLALHGHFGRAAAFAPLARALGGRHRVVALDQRGHGHSAGGGPFTPGDYAADAAAYLDALGTGPVAVVGHSMGGIVAVLLAAHRPDLVRDLIVVDIGMTNREPEVRPVLDVSAWPRRAATRAELGAAIRAGGVPDPGYFLESAVPVDGGWELLFDPADMMVSQRAFAGEYWDAWAAPGPPALLLHGTASMMLSAATADRMLRTRPGTRYAAFPGLGHWLHDEDPEGFARTVAARLDGRPVGTGTAG